MFPQSTDLNVTLASIHQAEIRAQFARYHMIRQARTAQPSHRPRWVAALPRALRAWRWAWGRDCTVRPTTVAEVEGSLAHVLVRDSIHM